MTKHTRSATNNVLTGSSASFVDLLPAHNIFGFRLHFIKALLLFALISFLTAPKTISAIVILLFFLLEYFYFEKVRCILIYKVILSFSYDVVRADCLFMRTLQILQMLALHWFPGHYTEKFYIFFPGEKSVSKKSLSEIIIFTRFWFPDAFRQIWRIFNVWNIWLQDFALFLFAMVLWLKISLDTLDQSSLKLNFVLYPRVGSPLNSTFVKTD